MIRKLQISAIRDSTICSTSKVEAGSSFINSKMDSYSFMGYYCDVNNTNIGKYVSIGNNVKIGGATHPMHWVSMSPVFYYGRDSISKKFSNFPRPIEKESNIGNDVWIGDSAIIMSGIDIGNGAVIGAGAIVTKNVPDYAIVAGSPAKIIRYRFSQEIIDKLLQIRWWDYSDNDIKKFAKSIKSPEEFIQFIEINNK
ncbi:CatB-related O-acetyltransferase [Gammaproteobacteria bacterium]|nr:CatB-related O-acetyltransferase [Gammaproteobacteria bacterium]